MTPASSRRPSRRRAARACCERRRRDPRPAGRRPAECCGRRPGPSVRGARPGPDRRPHPPGRGHRLTRCGIRSRRPCTTRPSPPSACPGSTWPSRSPTARPPTPSGPCGRSASRGCRSPCPTRPRWPAAVDDLSPVARRLGAVNCVRRRGDDLVGENTDGEGFLRSLRDDAGFDPGGRRCLVVGAGGAARAVVVALAGAGAREVAVANRSADAARDAVGLAGRVGRLARVEEADRFELVVNATPVGMEGGGASSGVGSPPGRSPAPRPGPGRGRLDLSPTVYDAVGGRTVTRSGYRQRIGNAVAPGGTSFRALDRVGASSR